MILIAVSLRDDGFLTRRSLLAEGMANRAGKGISDL